MDQLQMEEQHGLAGKLLPEQFNQDYLHYNTVQKQNWFWNYLKLSAFWSPIHLYMKMMAKSFTFIN